jgi:hypothetical protein
MNEDEIKQVPRKLARNCWHPWSCRCHPHRWDPFVHLNWRNTATRLSLQLYRFHWRSGIGGGSRKFLMAQSRFLGGERQGKIRDTCSASSRLAISGFVFLWMHIFRIANEERNGKNPRDGFTGPLRRGEALPWNEAGRRLQNYSQEETTLLQRGESAGQIPS